MCALIVTLAEYGNGSTNGHDKLTLKAESESPLQIARSPIIIPLPGGSIVGLDLGRNNAVLGISGIVDYEMTELFYDGIAGGSFAVGNTITGTAGWDSLTSPIRASAPTATVAGVTSTSLFITGLSPLTEWFVDNEPISNGSGVTANVNCPFPTKRRLEHVARYWYNSGQMTLTTRCGTYTGYVAGLEFNMLAGYEDRYQFKLSFAEGTQGLS